ncbi:MAG: PIN domain protein [Deltaproteobacteria bacterium]|nr:MAG: PIN domain protein [Deltaproteobacteria bacterium]
MNIYLDNCCFNRPFDDQSFIRIKLETDAKLHIQGKVRRQELELTWSYILEFENSMNPYKNKRERIQKWKIFASNVVCETPTILSCGHTFQEQGVKKKDSLHLACAIEGQCDYFLTTDDKLLKKRQDITEVHIISPVEFVTTILEERS